MYKLRRSKAKGIRLYVFCSFLFVSANKNISQNKIEKIIKSSKFSSYLRPQNATVFSICYPIIYAKKDAFGYKKIYLHSNLADFYLAISQKILKNMCFCEAKRLNLSLNRCSVKIMHSRWGSCNKRLKSINLNAFLITKNKNFIKAVICHELAHLTYANHSKEFYELLEIYFANYKTIIKQEN